MDFSSSHHSSPPCPLSYPAAPSHGHLSCCSSLLLFFITPNLFPSSQSSTAFTLSPSLPSPPLPHDPQSCLWMRTDCLYHPHLTEVYVCRFGLQIKTLSSNINFPLALTHHADIPPQMLRLHPLNHVKVLCLHEPRHKRL